MERGFRVCLFGQGFMLLRALNEPNKWHCVWQTNGYMENWRDDIGDLKDQGIAIKDYTNQSFTSAVAHLKYLTV